MPVACERCFDRLSITVPATVLDGSVALCEACDDELAYEAAAEEVPMSHSWVD